jgi:hypothetical protein
MSCVVDVHCTKMSPGPGAGKPAAGTVSASPGRTGDRDLGASVAVEVGDGRRTAAVERASDRVGDDDGLGAQRGHARAIAAVAVGIAAAPQLAGETVEHADRPAADDDHLGVAVLVEVRHGGIAVRTRRVVPVRGEVDGGVAHAGLHPVDEPRVATRDDLRVPVAGEVGRGGDAPAPAEVGAVAAVDPAAEGAQWSLVAGEVEHDQAVVVEHARSDHDLGGVVSVEVRQQDRALPDVEIVVRAVRGVAVPQHFAQAVDGVDHRRVVDERGDPAGRQAGVHDVGQAVAVDVTDRDRAARVRGRSGRRRRVVFGDSKLQGAGLAVEHDDVAEVLDVVFVVGVDDDLGQAVAVDVGHRRGGDDLVDFPGPLELRLDGVELRLQLARDHVLLRQAQARVAQRRLAEPTLGAVVAVHARIARRDALGAETDLAVVATHRLILATADPRVARRQASARDTLVVLLAALRAADDRLAIGAASSRASGGAGRVDHVAGRVVARRRRHPDGDARRRRAGFVAATARATVVAARGREREDRDQAEAEPGESVGKVQRRGHGFPQLSHTLGKTHVPPPTAGATRANRAMLRPTCRPLPDL